MNFTRHINQNEVGFQMGPMLDIIFILLIQFMVATMFANREDWIKISVPAATNSERHEQQDSEVVLTMKLDGSLFVDNSGEQAIFPEEWKRKGDDLVFPQLESILQDISRHNHNLKVVIRADYRVDHGMVVKVLDTCAKLKINRVAFATAKPAAGGKTMD